MTKAKTVTLNIEALEIAADYFANHDLHIVENGVIISRNKTITFKSRFFKDGKFKSKQSTVMGSSLVGKKFQEYQETIKFEVTPDLLNTLKQMEVFLTDAHPDKMPLVIGKMSTTKVTKSTKEKTTPPKQEKLALDETGSKSMTLLDELKAVKVYRPAFILANLEAAGIATLAKLKRTSDKKLKLIEGMSDNNLKKIRSIFN